MVGLVALCDPPRPETILTRVGLPGLKPLPWPQMLEIFGYAIVSCLVVNDAIKVLTIKWRAPGAA